MYAQYSLGRLYESGQGVQQDLTEAAGWYVRAADLGHPKASMKLAYLFRDGGPGLKPDGRLAVSYFEKAGTAGALNEIGLMYLKGTAVTRNAKIAHDWFEKAAAQGSVEAEYNLGLLFQAGYTGQPDYLQALGHFQTAANAKDGPSMLALGQLYAEGKGVPKDLVQAHTWFDLATANGTPEGATRAAAIEASMTPTEIVQAKAAVATWQPQDENALPGTATAATPLAEPVPAPAPVEAAPAPAAPTPAPAATAACRAHAASDSGTCIGGSRCAGAGSRSSTASRAGRACCRSGAHSGARACANTGTRAGPLPPHRRLLQRPLRPPPPSQARRSPSRCNCSRCPPPRQRRVQRPSPSRCNCRRHRLPHRHRSRAQARSPR